jgi:hypothetical protein
VAEESNNKPKVRILGDYLPISRGAKRVAMQKKRDAKLKGDLVKMIGEILLESGTISEEDLEIAIRKQRADRLGLCPVFESLSRPELTALSNHFKEISLPAGQQFIMQGENDPSLYILVSGRVQVFATDEDGTETHIAYVDPVEPIGEMGYFQGGKRYVSVRSIDPIEMLCASYSDLTNYFENVPKVALAFLEVVKRRQEETARLLEENK